MATPAVGEDIEDTCGRCGDTWHVVMAKMGERVVKVVCKRCGTQHNYRGNQNPVETKGGSGARRRTSTRRPSIADAAPVIPAFDPDKPPRPYSARDSYAPGERVAHPSFGVGVVSGSPGPGKVDVVFSTGVRVLASAKETSTLERPVHVKNVPISDRPPGSK